jgi:carbamoyltransferase
MNILGISDVTGNHSHSCIALLQEGELCFALSEERLSRVKNDNRFPSHTIQVALDYSGLRLEDIDQFACAYPPANYYGSLLKRSKWDLPRSLFGVLKRRPLKLLKYLGPNIKKGLFDPKGNNGLFDMGVPSERFRFIDHHLAHVSAAFRSSEFDECLGISYGGFAPRISGENLAGALFRCHGNRIEFLEPIPYFAAGCFFSGITVALGFNYMEQEGKTMGLAALGNPETCYEELRYLLPRYRDGQWRVYKNWIDYVMSPRKEVFLGTRTGRKILKLIDRHSPQDVAAAAQRILEENVTSLINFSMAKYSTSHLAVAGGIFLNIKLNRRLKDNPIVKEIFIHPHTGDGCTAIGAALETYAVFGLDQRLHISDMGLGMEYSDAAIENELRRKGTELIYEKCNGNVPDYAAQRLAESKIIGWFQGREEYGPRSLGHRCILGDPRKRNIRDRINEQIKLREAFIPLAVSCLAKHGSEFFKNYTATPFMTLAYQAYRNKVGIIPAALHVDGSSRVQGVDNACYALFRRLVDKFYQLTNIPMVLNTSLNQHGEPIAHRPVEAIELLIESPLDELIIGSYIVKKPDNSKA